MAVDHVRRDIALEDIAVAGAGPCDRDIDAEFVDRSEVQGTARRQHGGMAQKRRRDIDMRQG
jgi:hypothetical protein